MKPEEQNTKIVERVAVHYPKGRKLTAGREQAIADAIKGLSEAFGQDVWKVWLEPDNKGRMPYYAFIFTFDLRQFNDMTSKANNRVMRGINQSYGDVNDDDRNGFDQGY